MDQNSLYLESPVSTILHSKAIKLGLPVAATFELTPRCNFNCKMCYIHSDESGQKEKELDCERWIEIAEHARDMGVLNILLTGGEPLLRLDFQRLYLSLSQMGFVISMNTNGSLINDELFEMFKEYPPFRVNISLYGGSEETYSDLCGTKKFKTVVSNIKRLKELGISVVLNSTITPYNGDDLENIEALSRELDCNIKTAPYMYPPMRKDSSCIGENTGRYSPKEAAKMRVMYDELHFGHDVFIKRCRSATEKIEKLRKIKINKEFTEGFPLFCRAGRSTFWIDWRGNMLPCGMFGNKGVSLNDHSVEEAWSIIREETKKIHLPVKCRTCAVSPICNICAAVALTETGRFDGVPEYVCEMTEETARLMKERLEKENGV